METTLKLGRIEGKRRSEWQRMRWLDSITNTMDVNVKKLQEMVKNREAWHATVRGAVESDMTQRVNNNSVTGTRVPFDSRLGCYLWRPGQVSSCPNTTGFYMCGLCLQYTEALICMGTL